MSRCIWTLAILSPVAALLRPPPLGMLPRLPAISAHMQLLMPEDARTVDELIERTKQTDLLLVLQYADPTAFSSTSQWNEPNPWESDYGGAPSPIDDIVSRVATAYTESVQNGGRPLTVMRIDRDMPGMDLVCSRKGILSFPTIMVYSRGDGTAVLAGELESRLLSLGVAASRGSEPTSQKRGRSATAFGVGPRARRAQPEDRDDVGGEPPVEALGVGEAALSADPKVEEALDALFGEPSFGDVD